MKLVYFGTPQFAVPPLEAVLAAGHEVAAVYTQPDRPSGRGRKTAHSPVKQVAQQRGLLVQQPAKVRTSEVLEQLGKIAADAMVVVGYGQIIPQAIIDLPRLGIVNVHASLLPKYRGAAPIQWAVANGETHTGVTTMKIDAGLDTGDLLLSRETAIGPDEDAVTLSRRLSEMGATLLVETLAGLEAGAITPRPQNSSLATLARILKKEDGLVDWHMPAGSIHNRVRGFLPWPGGYCAFRGQRLQLWKTRVAERNLGSSPGTMHPGKRNILVTCGEGSSIELLEVQLEGRKRVNAESFLNGQHLTSDERLEGVSL